MLDYGLHLFMLENILVIEPLVNLDALQSSLPHGFVSKLAIPDST